MLFINIFLLSIFCLQIVNGENSKFFEVVFLDYMHEYNEVYANLDILETAEYKGFLCGSQECQDKYDLFAGLAQHYKKHQMARILLTNDEALFQQISKEGIKFCLTKMGDGEDLGENDDKKTLCYLRYKGKGRNGATYQFGGQSEETKNDDSGGLATSSEEEEDQNGDSPVIELNKNYKKAKANLDGLKTEGTNEKAAKERLYKMLDAVDKIILAKIGGMEKYTKSEARKLLLSVHVDKVKTALDIFEKEEVADVLAFEKKYAEEAREVLDKALH